MELTLKGEKRIFEDGMNALDIAGQISQDLKKRALAARLEHWFYRYRREWDKTSRQSGMPNLIRLMNAWADCLRGRAYGTVHVPGLRS